MKSGLFLLSLLLTSGLAFGQQTVEFSEKIQTAIDQATLSARAHAWCLDNLPGAESMLRFSQNEQDRLVISSAVDYPADNPDYRGRVIFQLDLTCAGGTAQVRFFDFYHIGYTAQLGYLTTAAKSPQPSLGMRRTANRAWGNYHRFVEQQVENWVQSLQQHLRSDAALRKR